MKTRWNMLAAALWVSAFGVWAGNLDPTNAPAPTMHTLEEIYQKLVDVEVRLVRAGIGVPLVINEMVTVSEAGNAGDTGGTPGTGAVSYEYRIGKYEVSNAEYSTFLNAVDPTGGNALALYSTGMNTDSRGGISNNVSGAEGEKYVVKTGRENKPVVFVSFYDAMRYCNWIHNGAVVGGDTESGAYTLLGGTAVPSNGTNVTRNAEATFAVPTEDEWYKAAYYDRFNAGADGNGNENYWLYPTMSDSHPTAEAPPGGANSANHDNAVGNVTDVGAYTGSPSYFGTFDQGGNVFEWIETLSGSSRILRGGSWDEIWYDLRSVDAATISPGSENFSFGFRISSP